MSLPQILIQNPLNFHLSKFQGFWAKRDRFGEKKFSVFFIHPSIHPQGCFSVGFFWRRLSLVSRDRRGVRSWRACGRAGGRTRGDDALRSRERGRDFCNAHNANSFPSRCSLFLLPCAKFIAVLPGLFLVMDSSRSAGVQEVRGERESRRIFSSSSALAGDQSWKFRKDWRCTSLRCYLLRSAKNRYERHLMFFLEV